MTGLQLGALIGAIGGVTFVMVNAGSLPTPWAWLVRILGGVALLSVLWRLPRLGSPSAQARPSGLAWRTYQLSTLLMLVAFPLGARALGAVGHPDLVVVWVVFVVGAHFLPFAGAFRAPVFRILAVALMVTALIGAGLGVAGWALAPVVAAVTSGFILLAFSGARS